MKFRVESTTVVEASTPREALGMVSPATVFTVTDPDGARWLIDVEARTETTLPRHPSPGWALLVGDPVDGITVYAVEGPDDPRIEQNFANETWWVVPVSSMPGYVSGDEDASSESDIAQGVIAKATVCQASGTRIHVMGHGGNCQFCGRPLVLAAG